MKEIIRKGTLMSARNQATSCFDTVEKYLFSYQ